MQMLVLAGGFGTRLQSAVSNVPKALAPVCGKPFLYYQLDQWVKQGVDEFVFLLHFQHEQILNFLNGQAQEVFGKAHFRSLTESTPLGTGGAVLNALTQLKIHGDFLLTNADTWLGNGVTRFTGVKSPALGVVHVPDAGRYGVVTVNESGHVASFSEKILGSHAGWINAGISMLNQESFQNKHGKSFSLESAIYPNLARSGHLRAVPLSGDFIDIGIPADYQRFCRWMEAQKVGDL